MSLAIDYQCCDRKYRFSDGSDVNSNTQRKLLAETYNAASNLDKDTFNYQVEKDFNEYIKLQNQNHDLKSRSKGILEKNRIRPNLKTNLTEIRQKIPQRPPENFTESEFKNCMRIIQKPFDSWPKKSKSSDSQEGCYSRAAKLRRTDSDEATVLRTEFKTAREELNLQPLKKMNLGPQKRHIGIRRNVHSKFVPPLINRTNSTEGSQKSDEWDSDVVDERLKNIDPKMVELIKSEIMDVGATVQWEDIAGLDFAKTTIQEAVVWPMLRPDIFTGLRRPPKGILLFGPPGTGKTLIGKCVASKSKSTFFSISASSLTSKWVGDGEKMVRALFAVARCYQPAVIFIDEIDSLLSQRSDTEHECSRRIKTEFLVQLDGATTNSEERLLLIGATNRPQELDEAARRRFVKRLYIPLPEYPARLQLITRLISSEKNSLKSDDFEEVAKLSEGYSGADIRNLCSEAALGPIRSIDFAMMEKIQAEDVRPLSIQDFHKAFQRVRSSVSGKDLEQYVTWDGTYGSGL